MKSEGGTRAGKRRKKNFLTETVLLKKRRGDFNSLYLQKSNSPTTKRSTEG